MLLRGLALDHQREIALLQRTESGQSMTTTRFHKVTYGTSLSSGRRLMENHYNPMQIKLLKDKVSQK